MQWVGQRVLSSFVKHATSRPLGLVEGNRIMKIETALIALGPVVLVAAAIAYFNPAILTWPVVGGLSLTLGVVGGIAADIVEPE